MTTTQLSPSAAEAYRLIVSLRDAQRAQMQTLRANPLADSAEHAERLAQHRAAIHAYECARLAVIVADERNPQRT